MRDLAASFVHMFTNRLIRQEGRAHEMVLYDFLLRCTQSRIARERAMAKRAGSKREGGKKTKRDQTRREPATRRERAAGGQR